MSVLHRFSSATNQSLPMATILPISKVIYLSEDRWCGGVNSGAASDLESRWLQKNDGK
jgi:hypothetical protein